MKLIGSLIDDKKKARVREAIAKNDPGMLWPKKKAEPEPAMDKKQKRQLSPEEQQKLDSELLAASHHDFKRVKALLEGGANPNARNEDGETALMVAVRAYENTLGIAIFVPVGGSAEDIRKRQHDLCVNTLELLLAAGADVNATDSQGRTAWDYSRDSSEHIRALFEKYGATNLK